MEENEINDELNFNEPQQENVPTETEAEAEAEVKNEENDNFSSPEIKEENIPINNTELEKTNEQDSFQEEVADDKKNKSPVFLLLIVLILIGVIVGALYFSKNNKSSTTEVNSASKNSAYRMTGNGLQKFDLYFLQLENEEGNKVYSPLSIKYALEMLSEGANGESKTQIDAIVGDYVAKKYINSKNMSFANALFIRNSFKDEVKTTYIEKLQNKYNAEIIYDEFATPDNLNNWVKDKTLNLIGDLFTPESIDDAQVIITNALGIDMEWIKTIQPDETRPEYMINYVHEDFDQYVPAITNEKSYDYIKFNNGSVEAKSSKIAAAINKYDIIKTLGEDSIRKTVTEEYEKWLKGEGKDCSTGESAKEIADKYVKELGKNYGLLDSSTDFMFYDDDNLKAFAKDLKTYNGTTLQYVGIMPKNVTLKDYVKNATQESISTVISNLKDIKLDNFKEGVVTEIVGNIPLFKFDYSLNLMSDLKQLGIVNVFDENKADFTNIINSKNMKFFVNNAAHKATIEFSNKGIKAAAATEFGLGDMAGCSFEYDFKVPVEKIDLTFNNPYMFLIRDKNSGEVWFTGTVYTPITK